MTEVTVTLTVEDVNRIVDVLSRQPYADVFQVVNRLRAAAQRAADRELLTSAAPAARERLVVGDAPGAVPAGDIIG